MRVAAAYIRVSTEMQTEYSPDSQLRLIREYAKKNDLIINDEYIFSDEGISGRTADKRPAFQKMISLAKQRCFEVILVYSTSRFARNHEESVVYRSMLEKQCNVELISITQPNIDKRTDMLTSAIYSIMDEWYSLDLSENVKRGMTQKALTGATQTAPPLGYDLIQSGSPYVVNEEEAKYIQYVFHEFLKNTSKWKIARNLNMQGAKTKKGHNITSRNIDYYLRNVTYKGYSSWTPDGKIPWSYNNPNTIIMKAKHPAIIDEDVFDQVQKKLETQDALKVRKARPLETKKHWLSGMIKCASCGSSLAYNGVCATRKRACFRCGSYNKGACRTMNFILVDEAEKLLIDYLSKIFNNIDVLYDANLKNVDSGFSEIKFLNEELKKLDRKYDRAKLAFLDEAFDLTEYKELKIAIDNEKEKIRMRLSELNQPISYVSFHSEIRNVYETLIGDSFTKDQKHLAIKSVIENIIYDKKSGLFQINFYS